MKKSSFRKMTEEDVKDKYPNASLHLIDKNRICLTINQLKLILGLKDDDFNNILTKLCEKELKKKKGKSLDFYDTSNLIDQAIKERKKMGKDELEDKPSLNKLKTVSFKEEEEVSEEEEDEDDDQKEVEKEDEKEGLTRLDMIETRVKKLEKKVDYIEEAIKEGI